MKAVILAAGKGSRLKGIINTLPKPMIDYIGKPVLQHNIELLKKNSIESIFINLHTLPEIIKGYFEDGKKYGVQIKYSYEAELLGTAGAVKKIANDYWQSDNDQNEIFFVVYGDNYSNYNIMALKEKILSTNAVAVIAFHHREDTSHSGVAEFDESDRIIKFVEKPCPGESDSHWVNAGIYCMSTKILQYIPSGASDFSQDIFPLLLKSGIDIYGVCEDTEVKAFDTPDMYNNSMNKVTDQNE